MTYSVTEHVNEYEEASIEQCCKRLVDILDTRECSDSGREFAPTYITSCRVLHTMELTDIIKRMREIL